MNQHMYNYASSIVMWSCDTDDWKLETGAVSVSDVVHGIKDCIHRDGDGPILLMHDLTQDTAEVLDRIIPFLKKKGYKFVTANSL